MTQYLPPNLLALFSARPPIAFKPPTEKLKKKGKSQPYSGVSDFITSFDDQPPSLATRGETREEKDERRKKEREIKTKIGLEEKLASWDPHTDANASGDPFKTLFVGRINYDTSETKLRRELEAYGPVRRIQMVYNMRSRKPRGYAFVEFEHEKDMHSAYKHADGKKIDGRRILVDVERGRTVKSWRPRRLGGGLGGTRIGGPDDNIRHSGRVEQWERERGKEKERRRSRSPRDQSQRRGDREKPRDDKPRDDKPRDDKPRDDKPRDDKPREDKSRDSSRTRERGGDKDRKRERGGADDKDRERPKRSRDEEKKEPKKEEKEEPSEEKKDRRERDRDRSGRDRDGGRDRERRDRGDRGKERAERGEKDARDEPAEKASGSTEDAGAENHVADTNGDGQQEAMGNSNGEAVH